MKIINNKFLLFFMQSIFLISACGEKKPTQQDIYLRYLKDNFGLIPPEINHRYFCVSSIACIGCVAPAIRNAIKISNDSSTTTLIISENLTSPFHLDTLSKQSNVFIDYRNNINRLKIPNATFIIYTSQHKIDSIIPFGARL